MRRNIFLCASGTADSPQISAATQKLVTAVYGVRTVNVRQIAGIDSLPDARTIVTSRAAERFSINTAKKSASLREVRCPALLTKAKAQRNLDALLAQYIVEFNPASAQLTARGRGILDRVAPLLTASPASRRQLSRRIDFLLKENP
jgi:hypothetical protein